MCRDHEKNGGVWVMSRLEKPKEENNITNLTPTLGLWPSWAVVCISAQTKEKKEGSPVWFVEWFNVAQRVTGPT